MSMIVFKSGHGVSIKSVIISLRWTKPWLSYCQYDELAWTCCNRCSNIYSDSINILGSAPFRLIPIRLMWTKLLLTSLTHHDVTLTPTLTLIPTLTLTPIPTLTQTITPTLTLGLGEMGRPPYCSCCSMCHILQLQLLCYVDVVKAVTDQKGIPPVEGFGEPRAKPKSLCPPIERSRNF